MRKTTKMKCLSQKSNRESSSLSLLYQDCAIKLLLSSHGVGIPFIASFINSFSFPVRFIAMIFELLFPVKTFQLLRGRKILCKQSGVRVVNGLHLSIQGNPIICMCASIPESRSSSIASVWDHNKMRGAIICCKQSFATHPPVSSPLVVCFSLQTCASRLSREQARVRALWRQAASLRSTFTQLRTFTDR